MTEVDEDGVGFLSLEVEYSCWAFTAGTKHDVHMIA